MLWGWRMGGRYCTRAADSGELADLRLGHQELTRSLAMLKMNSAVAELSSRGDVLGVITSTCVVST